MHKETEEQTYLQQLLKKVEGAIQDIDSRIQSQIDDIKQAKDHMQEHKRDMDHLEKNAVREVISNIAMQGDHAIERKKRLLRLRDVPYFGRIDFQANGRISPQPIYIGVSNFWDEQLKQNMVYDWRAPISSMFYDFELGPAFYETHEGKVEGSVALKRQFRIRKGKMEYMLDSEVTINDEVLQQELNRASSGKMKNIVATIQREQNRIIRNEEARHMIIQGVAGSGKTSIALHRIAFLLYKFKDTISSDDILIISPNKVFSAYIANVLPELGEETVAETSMEEIARMLFEDQISFQGFFDQVSDLLTGHDQKLIERIQFKSSRELLKNMDSYLLHLENTGFKPEDIVINKKPVPAWFIEEKFALYNKLPLLNRFNEMVEDIVKNVLFYYNYEIAGKERSELHRTIRKMFPSVNLRMLYKGLYGWMGRPELLKMRKGSIYEYSDVYPLLYLKMKLEGMKPNKKVKHLVVDEMQDYSFVQYKVLSQLFPCRKTILGDINQSVNPFSASDLLSIASVFPDATTMTILKSYRSTYEIAQFSRQLYKNIIVEPLERHGDKPSLAILESQDDEVLYLEEQVAAFEQSNFNSLGIICKTQEQANLLHASLAGRFETSLIDPLSAALIKGIVITAAYLAKGLEFDQVIVPFVTTKNYQTPTDLRMLYVACTRAMHVLKLSCTKKPSRFLPEGILIEKI